MPLEKQSYCSHCHQVRLCHSNRVVHWKQALLTLVTCGLWLPVWIGLMLSPGWRCSVCDQPVWKDDTK